MSASFGSSNSQDVDINITPIIDCFTVLITFLLASASFLSIGFIEASTPGTAADTASAEPDAEVLVKMKANHIAQFTVKGKHAMNVTFDLNNKESIPNLQKQIDSLQAQHLKFNQVLVSADDDVDYKLLSELMGGLQKTKVPLVVGEF